jgi:hypothetical protein
MHSRFHTNAGYDQLRLNVEAIQKYITEGGQMDVSRVKKIDRKLKKCLNPEFIPGTEEYALRFRFFFPFSSWSCPTPLIDANGPIVMMMTTTTTTTMIMMIRYAKRREREQAERAARRQEKLRRQAEGQIDAEGTYSSRRPLAPG